MTTNDMGIKFSHKTGDLRFCNTDATVDIGHPETSRAFIAALDSTLTVNSLYAPVTSTVTNRQGDTIAMRRLDNEGSLILFVALDSALDEVGRAIVSWNNADILRAAVKQYLNDLFTSVR